MTAKIAREKLSLAQCLKPSCETAIYHGKLCCAAVALCYNPANQLSLTVAQPFQQALLKRVCIYNHSGLHIIEVLLYTVKPVGQYSLCDGHYLYSINSPSCRVKEKGVYWCCRNHSWLGIMLWCEYHSMFQSFVTLRTEVSLLHGF